MRGRLDRAALIFGVVMLTACSALVDPDESRFGPGDDAGPAMDGATGDAGELSDAGADAGGGGCPGGCDDGVACTTDRCVADACENTPDDDACDAGERCNPVMGCVPERCENNAQCDDGLVCNGVETCSSMAPGTGCVAGTPPVCDDGFSCTDDACEEAAGGCVATPVDARCGDPLTCTVDACDPATSTRETGCVNRPDDGLCDTEFCTVGRVCGDGGCTGGTPRNCEDMDPCTAETCNETTDACDSAPLDADMDGFPADSAVGPGGTVVRCGGTDCDDSMPGVNPMAMEICGDGIDNDCANGIDDGCLPDDCSSALPILLDASGRGTVSGRLGDFTSDYQTSPICMGQPNARDAVYYIDLPVGSWDVTIDTNGSAADTLIAAGLTCDNAGFALVCNDDQNRGMVTQSRIWLHQIGSASTTTRVFILVDGWGTTETGAFDLNVQRVAARADSCLGAGPMNISGGGSLLGRTVRGTNFYSGTCASTGASGTEAIFQLRGAGSDEIDVFSTMFNPTIYMRRSNCRTGTQIECDVGSSIGGGINQATINPSLSSGVNHYLFVDGASNGDFYTIYYEP